MEGLLLGHQEGTVSEKKFPVWLMWMYLYLYLYLLSMESCIQVLVWWLG